MQPMRELHGFFFDVGLLQSLDIISAGWADGRVDEAAVDRVLLSTFEAIARVYWGLKTRSYIIWSGGVYNSCLLCSGDNHLRQAAINRAQRLQPRVQIVDEMLSSESGLPDSLNRPGLVACSATTGD